MITRMLSIMLAALPLPVFADSDEQCHLQFMRTAEKIEISEDVIPAAYTIEQATSQQVVFSEPETARSAFLVQQILNAVKFDKSTHAAWNALPESDVRQVIAIHSGTMELVGNSPAQKFYQTMLLSFMSLGAAEYIQNSYTCDPSYSQDELAEYWGEFSHHFANAVNSDLDYTAQFAPQFSYTLAGLFTSHPLSEWLLLEVDTVETQVQNAESAAQIAENNAQVAANNAEMAN